MRCCNSVSFESSSISSFIAKKQQIEREKDNDNNKLGKSKLIKRKKKNQRFLLVFTFSNFKLCQKPTEIVLLRERQLEFCGFVYELVEFSGSRLISNLLKRKKLHIFKSFTFSLFIFRFINLFYFSISILIQYYY